MSLTDGLPTNCYVAAHLQFNQEQTLGFRRAESDLLLEFAKKTNRYIVCDCGLGVFEVLDGRRLLDGLLQWQALLPVDEETGLSHFEELRKQQSGEPLLNKADQEVLLWLTEIAGAYDGEPDELYYAELWQAATMFKGTEAEVRRFLLAKL
jgi:hypothetical protein